MAVTVAPHKEALAGHLAAARERSLTLLDPVPDADQLRQHSPLMSPLVWDLAHVANYEELWLLRNVAGISVAPEHDAVYNPFENPRATRAHLPILPPAAARRYAADVRGRALDVLDTVDLDPASPLLAAGFVYGMVIQHEYQHDETMLATLQLRAAAYPPAATAPPPPATPTDRGGVRAGEVFVDGGPFVMGTDVDPWGYDNERPSATVDVAPFFIDALPVTNAQYAEFIAAGGYDDRRWWNAAGWSWRTEAALGHPQFWARDGAGGWVRTRFGIEEAVPPAQPVMHVCWYEADAYARWAGKRLPTEAEWEKAASWDPHAGRKRRFPWGDADPTPAHANVGQRHFSPAVAGAYPAGASAYGCEQMVGDVWEWTASDFQPYPGFAAFPYREYSEVFFGSEYKVLRGASWAASETVARCTFRNWDYPIRRQIFAGFRCARDA